MFKLIKENKYNRNKHYQYITHYMLPYTIAFILLQYIVFLPFTIENKSFIWNVDGINQHYPVLQFYSQLLQNFIQSKGFPMVDFRIGMGFDTITTLNYYALGDPLTLLVVFASPENMEKWYKFLILLRLYLSGVSFLIYCNYRQKKAYASILGSLVYVFCGYVFYAATRHPYFTNSMIYLPLLFTGLEAVLKKKKPYLFIIVTCISAISNFYFFYMITIFIFFYGIIRYFALFYNQGQEKPVTLFLQTAFRAIGFYCLGLLMASFLFLPVVTAFTNNGRFHSGYAVNLFHYTKGYYVLLVNSFLASNVSGGYWTKLTFAAIVPPAILMIFRYKKYWTLMILFIITTLVFMIPFFGYMMNGFSYVSNRHEFGYSFLVAYIFVAVYEDLFRLKPIDKVLLILGTGIYLLFGLIRPNVYIWVGFGFLCITLLCLFLFNHFKNHQVLFKGVLFLIVFTNLCVNGYLVYDKNFGNYVEEFIDSGKVQDTINASGVTMLSDIKDTTFYRVESYGDKQRNEALTLGFYDVSGYYSVMDKRVGEYMKGLELLNQKTAYRFDNLDYRTSLGTLGGVKYFVTPNLKATPYGYKVVSKEKHKNKTYYLLENQYALSLGYTYNKFITREIYEQLNVLQKQEIMLHLVVLEDAIAESGEIEALNEGIRKGSSDGTFFTGKKLPVTYEYEGGIIKQGEYIEVTQKDAKLIVKFEGIVNAETYLRLENFNINETKYLSIDFKVKGENTVTKSVNVRSESHNSYFGKENYVINLGYQEKAMNKCELIFKHTGKFYLGDIEVYAQPMETYVNEIMERRQGQLQDITMENNRITGVSVTKEDAILCLSIPYSKGWSAYVNGEKSDLLQANIMYMALPLKAGENHIELRYTTPYLKAGAILSAIGLGVFIGLIMWTKLRKKEENN